mmetsp:Transcript_2573/g.7035  ORF Transcript_2573/g.7035 Transcript_2573/m.7035 type:complete len:313 (-) Transcript_2573:266-1204(-)
MPGRSRKGGDGRNAADKTGSQTSARACGPRTNVTSIRMHGPCRCTAFLFEDPERFERPVGCEACGQTRCPSEGREASRRRGAGPREEGVGLSLSRGRPGRGVHDQQSLDQVHPGTAELWALVAYRLEVRGRPARIAGLPERQALLEAWPGRLGGGAQQLHDLDDCANLGIPREYRASGGDLGKDTSRRPDVHRQVVAGMPQQNLWAAIPQGDDIPGVALDPARGHAGQAEVANFEAVNGMDEDVLRLEVTMNHTLCVARVDSVEETLPVQHDLLHGQLRTLPPVTLQNPVQVVRDVLEDQLEPVQADDLQVL